MIGLRVGSWRGTRSDRKLMARINAGSTDALGELYDRYCVRAYQVALSVCPDSARAEDAVQNAFLSVWKSRSSYREQRGTVATWLLSTVRHRAIDLARSNGGPASGWAADRSRPAGRDPSEVPEQVTAGAERERLLSLLDSLPDAHREVITLAFYGGLSHTEIAEHLDLPAGTVKGRMRLGLNKLRPQIELDDVLAHRDPTAPTAAGRKPTLGG